MTEDRDFYVKTVIPSLDSDEPVEVPNPILDDGYHQKLEPADIIIMHMKHSRKEIREMYEKRGYTYDPSRKRFKI